MKVEIFTSQYNPGNGINNWLSKNQQIKVFQITHSNYVDEHGYNVMVIYIWYEEPDSSAPATDPLLSKVFAKYIQYIKDVEGGDYILTHSERHASSVVFTDEEWELLTTVAKNCETNGKN